MTQNLSRVDNVLGFEKDEYILCKLKGTWLFQVNNLSVVSSAAIGAVGYFHRKRIRATIII